MSSLLLKLLGTRLSFGLDKWVVRYTGWSFVESTYDFIAGVKPLVPSLLLVTRGHSSGRKRSAVLPYYVTNGKIFIVGSKGGAPRDPAWASNLRHCPDAIVYVQRRRKRVRARISMGEERSLLWKSVTLRKPVYAQYQRKTTREIPLFILEDVPSPASIQT